MHHSSDNSSYSKLAMVVTPMVVVIVLSTCIIHPED